MKTFLSLVPAGSGGFSSPLAIPAARQRGVGSRGKISLGVASAGASYGGSRVSGDLGLEGRRGGGGVGGG